jgi:hypothetical protein
MADEVFCAECRRELRGVLEIETSEVGNHAYLVTIDAPDCNWRLCNTCKTIICKACNDRQRYYCCDEGYILTHERATQELLRKRLAESR